MPSPKKLLEKHNKDQISNMIDFMKDYKQMRIERHEEARKFITTQDSGQSGSFKIDAAFEIENLDSAHTISVVEKSRGTDAYKFPAPENKFGSIGTLRENTFDSILGQDLIPI